jgi:hypothetical protein
MTRYQSSPTPVLQPRSRRNHLSRSDQKVLTARSRCPSIIERTGSADMSDVDLRPIVDFLCSPHSVRNLLLYRATEPKSRRELGAVTDLANNGRRNIHRSVALHQQPPILRYKASSNLHPPLLARGQAGDESFPSASPRIEGSESS